MRAGLPISLGLHAGILLAGTIAFNNTQPIEPGIIVPVELLSVEEFTDIRASIKREAPEPEPEPDPNPSRARSA